jgi:hypothetical protein
MPKSPTGIIPAEFNHRRFSRDVINYLKAMPLPGEDKVEVFFGWSRNWGHKVTSAENSELRQTGNDR